MSTLEFQVAKQTVAGGDIWTSVASYDAKATKWSFTEGWTRMFPNAGSSTGSEKITVIGAGFTPGNGQVFYELRFNDSKIQIPSPRADAVNTTHLVIDTPPWTSGNALTNASLFSVGGTGATAFADLVPAVIGVPPVSSNATLFKYRYRPSWKSISPTTAYARGSSFHGIQVTVTGAGFSANLPYICNFAFSRNAMNTSASVVNYMRLVCDVPDWGSQFAGASTVFSLFEDGTKLPRQSTNPLAPQQSTELYFSIYEEWYNIGQLGGLASGGTQVPVHGSGFDVQEGPIYACRMATQFGETLTTVPVAASSSTRVLCTTRPWPFSDLAPRLDLMRNGQPVFYSGNGTMRFQYLAESADSWQAASPLRADATGGMSITITASSFSTKITYGCKFTAYENSSWVVFSDPAKPQSSDRFVCALPRWGYAAGEAFIDVVQAGRLVTFSGNTAQRLFQFVASIDAIAAKDFAGGICDKDPELPAIGQCITGRMSGGQLIQVRGAGFSLSRQIFCVFTSVDVNTRYSEVTPATVLTANSLECKTPRWQTVELLAKVFLELEREPIDQPGQLYFQFIPDLQNQVAITMLDSAFGPIDTFDRPGFVTQFSKAIQCSEEQIQINHVTNGSVVVNMSIVSNAGRSGIARVAYLKELADRNDMVLRRMQIIGVLLYDAEGNPKRYSFAGTCPGPLSDPCNGNGNKSASSPIELQNGCIKPADQLELPTCDCAPGYGLGDCRTTPGLLQVCVGENITQCNPYILPRQFDNNITIRVIVGNMPSSDKSGFPKCVLEKESGAESVEVYGVLLKSGLVACNLLGSPSALTQLNYGHVCGDPEQSPRKGRWRVSVVLSDLFDNFKTREELFITCFGDIQRATVCAGAAPGDIDTPMLCGSKAIISTSAAQKALMESNPSGRGSAVESYLPQLRVQLLDVLSQPLPVDYKLTISLDTPEWQTNYDKRASLACNAGHCNPFCEWSKAGPTGMCNVDNLQLLNAPTGRYQLQIAYNVDDSNDANPLRISGLASASFPLIVEPGLPTQFGVIAMPTGGFQIKARNTSLTQMIAPVALLDGAGNPTPYWFFGEIMQIMRIEQFSEEIRSIPFIYQVPFRSQAFVENVTIKAPGGTVNFGVDDAIEKERFNKLIAYQVPGNHSTLSGQLQVSLVDTPATMNAFPRLSQMMLTDKTSGTFILYERCGAHENAQGTCGCMEGYEWNYNLQACTECLNGFYKEQIGNSKCTPCPLGKDTQQKTASDNRRDCVCTPGKTEDQVTYECTECLKGFMCEPTVTKSLVKSGWWRLNKQSPTAIRCKTPSACCGDADELLEDKLKSMQATNENVMLIRPAQRCKKLTIAEGGSLSQESQYDYNCAKGYMGAMCAQCTQQYGRSEGLCKICDEESLGQLSFAAIVCIYFLAIFMFLFLKSGDETITLPVAKLFLMLLQQISMISNLDVYWPPATSFALDVFRALSSSFSFEYYFGDCALQNLDVYEKFVLGLSVPPMVTIAIMMPPTLHYFRQKGALYAQMTKFKQDQKRGEVHVGTEFDGMADDESIPYDALAMDTQGLSNPLMAAKENLKDTFWRTIVIVGFLVYPMLLLVTFKMLKCINPENDVDVTGIDTKIELRFLEHATSKSCDESDYKANELVAVFFVFIYAAGTPVCILLALVFNYFALTDPRKPTKTAPNRAKNRYYFLIAGYKQKRWFWEVIVTLRKIAQAFIIVFVKKSEQATYYSMLMLLALTLHVVLEPFEPKWNKLNNLEQISMAILLVSVLGSRVYKLPASAKAELGEQASLTEYVVIGCAALWTLLLLLITAFHFVKDLIEYVEGLRAEKGKTKPKYMFGFGSYDVMQPWQRTGMSQRETADMFEFITALRRTQTVDPTLTYKLDGLAMSQDPRLSAIVQVYKKYPNMRQLSRRLGALLNEKLDLLNAPTIGSANPFSTHGEDSSEQMYKMNGNGHAYSNGNHHGKKDIEMTELHERIPADEELKVMHPGKP
jgi:hypothetical protein